MFGNPKTKSEFFLDKKELMEQRFMFGNAVIFIERLKNKIAEKWGKSELEGILLEIKTEDENRAKAS